MKSRRFAQPKKAGNGGQSWGIDVEGTRVSIDGLRQQIRAERTQAGAAREPAV